MAIIKTQCDKLSNMAIPAQKFSKQKALHTLLYVVSRLPQPANVYNVLKCIWFADRAHLERFGRQIYGESYFAPEHGPVPSRAYDMVKYVSGRSSWDLHWPELFEAISATKTEITSKISPDLDVLSRSELICLNESCEKYGQLSFGKLKRLSHQSDAFKNADQNGEINFDALVDELGDGELREHLLDRYPGEANQPQAAKRANAA